MPEEFEAIFRMIGSLPVLYAIVPGVLLAMLVWALLRWRLGMRDESGARLADAAQPQPMISSAGLPFDVVSQARELAEQGKKIDAIKLVRQSTNWGLKEAKEYVEALQAGASVSFVQSGTVRAPQAASFSPAVANQVRELADQGKTIEAIKLVRQYTAWGLKEASEYVKVLQTDPSVAGVQAGAAGTPQAADPSLSMADNVRKVAEESGKIEAIKLVRLLTKWSLKDAKEYVERLIP